MPETPRKAPGFERWIAALVFAVPLYYLATQRTHDVFVITWSKHWTVMILAYAAFYAGLLLSYSRALPRWVRAMRTLGVLVPASVMAALVCIEITLRATDHAQFAELDASGRHAPDPDLGHVFLPNYVQTLQSREYSIEWKSNSQGVRADREFGRKKPGVFRVLAVGDSFTEGAQVPYRDTWPAQLESCLNEHLSAAGIQDGGAGRVEVVDAGFPGYATVNEARWIAKFGVQFAPDLVLVAATANDLLENQFPLQYTARDGRMVSSASTQADELRYEQHRQWWCLAGVIERSMLMDRFDHSPATKRLLGRPPVTHMEAYMVDPNEKAERLWKLADQYMLDARDAATRLGAKFGVVVIPYNHQLHPLGPGLDPTLFGRKWVELGAANHFPVVDCLPAFLTAAHPETLHWKEDMHCTAAGYHLVGSEVCRALLAHAAEVGLPAPAK
jgi:lysophospholipase L1-like esterase